VKLKEVVLEYAVATIRNGVGSNGADQPTEPPLAPPLEAPGVRSSV
jgi:hypothetical protein